MDEIFGGLGDDLIQGQGGGKSKAIAKAESFQTLEYSVFFKPFHNVNL